MTAIEKLERLPCPTCGGSKQCFDPREQNILRRSTDKIKAPSRIPCLSCQENGTPTGLAPIALALTGKCGNVRHFLGELTPDGTSQYPADWHEVSECGECGGTGQVPKSEAEQLWELLGWARNRCRAVILSTYAFSEKEPCDSWEARLTRGYPIVETSGWNTSPLEALAAALLASQEHET